MKINLICLSPEYAKLGAGIGTSHKTPSPGLFILIMEGGTVFGTVWEGRQGSSLSTTSPIKCGEKHLFPSCKAVVMTKWNNQKAKCSLWIKIQKKRGPMGLGKLRAPCCWHLGENKSPRRMLLQLYLAGTGWGLGFGKLKISTIC